MTRFACVACAFLAFAACGFPPSLNVSPAPVPLRDAAAGCWELRSSRGVVRSRVLETTQVRLDTVPATVTHDLRMTVLSDSTRRWLILHWGTYAGGDSLGLVLSTGFGGVFVRAALRGDELRGEGESWVDIPSIKHTGRVRGRRIPCPVERPA